MKSLKSPQRVVLIFLTSFIVVCCFFIIRLEIKAANLQSRWDEHQKSLKINEDVLYDLNKFTRDVKDGSIAKLVNGNTMLVLFGDKLEGLSGDDINFGSSDGKTNYFGYNSKTQKTYMKAVGNGAVSIGNKNDKNYLSITDNDISMNSSGQNNNTSGFLLSSKLGGGQMFNIYGNNKSLIELDKGKIGVQGAGDINIEGKKLKMENASGKCEIILSEEDIHIVCTPSNGPVFGVLFSSSSQSISINTNDASIILAKDVIHFEAESDINITSKNGNVNIKGNKVKVNE